MQEIANYIEGRHVEPASGAYLDNTDPAMTVAELSQPIYAFKSGKQTITRALPELHGPG